MKLPGLTVPTIAVAGSSGRFPARRSYITRWNWCWLWAPAAPT
jgi:hypothetical protein